MSTTMTLADLRTAVRQRADMVNSQFVSDSELISYINQSYFELYDLLVQKYGDDYYVAPPVTFVTDGINQSYSLPDGSLYSSAPALLKLRGVDLNLTNNTDGWITLRRFNFSERNKYAVPNFQSFYGITNLRYCLSGSSIFFSPVPAANQTIRLWYIPRMTQLSSDSDTLDGISGWTEYVIVDAAIKCMQKEESDVSVLMNQKMALINRIEAAAENRDAGEPMTVSDSRNQGADWGAWGDNGGFGGY